MKIFRLLLSIVVSLLPACSTPTRWSVAYEDPQGRRIEINSATSMETGKKVVHSK